MYNLIIEEYIFSLGALISLPLRRNIFFKKCCFIYLRKQCLYSPKDILFREAHGSEWSPECEPV